MQQVNEAEGRFPCCAITISQNFVLVKRIKTPYNISEIYILRGGPAMNNTDMETFWAVLEHGTLTAAAEALFITQPTLTNRIQSLEAEVGAQLFHRGKGIRWPTAGRRCWTRRRAWRRRPRGNICGSARCFPPTSTFFRRRTAAFSTGSCRWPCGCRPCVAQATMAPRRWPAVSWRWP